MYVGAVTKIPETEAPYDVPSGLSFLDTERLLTDAAPNVAVCLLPGTEVAFENDVRCEHMFAPALLPTKKIDHKVARFRQINQDRPAVHHDALEFPDGQLVLVTRLCEGQKATVLQLPATAGTTAQVGEQNRMTYVG